MYGLEFSTGVSTSPLRAVAILTLDHFHKVSRAVGPQETGVTFILEAGGEPCGLVAGTRDPHDSSVVHLMAMWVHPHHRGTGAANLLVLSVSAWAAEVGAAQVRLNVIESNSRARRCYERAGFRATGRQSVLERTGDVEIEMACDGQQLLGFAHKVE